MAYDPTLRIPKGQSLTWEELDENFQALQVELADLTAFVQSNDKYVSAMDFVDGEISVTLNNGASFTQDLDTRYIKLSGGALTGPLTLQSDPTFGLHAATKQYVDSKISSSTYDTNDFTVDFNNSSFDNLTDVNVGGAIPGQFLQWDGAEWIAANTSQNSDTTVSSLNFSQLTGNVAITSSDGAIVHTNIDGRYLPLDGNVRMSGYFELFADPIFPLNPVTKQYVDNALIGNDTVITSLVFDSNTNVLTASVSDGNTYQTSINVSSDQLIQSIGFDSTNGLFTANVANGSVMTTSIDGRYIQSAGDTMTGPLVLNADPTLPLESATKQYVDNSILSANNYSTANFVIDLGASSINQLSDVTSNTAAIGEVLTWNGAAWVGGTPNDDDTTITNLNFNSASGILTVDESDGNSHTTFMDGRYSRSVNGIVPDGNGNIAISITETQTGTLPLPATANNGVVFVVSGEANTALNGETYIYVDGVGWQSVKSFDEAAADVRYINASGDSMTGVLQLAADPTANLHAATKQYVDNQLYMIDELLDVNTAGVLDTQVLAYDQTSSVWKPADIQAPIDSIFEDVGFVTGGVLFDPSGIKRSFKATMTGNIAIAINPPANAGYEYGITIRIVGNGGTVSWNPNIQWNGGTAPSDPGVGETFMYVLSTVDQGTTWQANYVGYFV